MNTSTQTQNVTSQSTQSNTPAKEVTMNTNPSSNTTPSTVTPATVGLAPPPSNANIPSPPPGFIPVTGGFAKSIRPTKAELMAMPDAIVELQSFTDYAAVLGQTVPAQANVITTFGTAGQWSVMRVATMAWEAYVSNEEGVGWTAVRQQIASIKPAFNLAAAANPALLTTYPKLATLLGAKSAAAKKGSATKAANKKAKAAGEPATHGASGKKAQTKAAKAALAAAQSKAPAPPPTPTPPAASPAATSSTASSGAAANGASHA